MPQFSARSLTELSTCHADLQELFSLVVQTFDCTIIEGWRGEERQNELFRTGQSEVRWPDGRHNERPSRAVDAAPCPINWNDRRRFDYFAGYVKGTADRMGIPIRWGGDWDGDHDLSDQTFMDLVHYELIE